MSADEAREIDLSTATAPTSLPPSMRIAYSVSARMAARGDDVGPNVTAVLLMTIDMLAEQLSDTLAVLQETLS